MIHPITFCSTQTANNYPTNKHQSSSMQGRVKALPVKPKSETPLHAGMSNALSWFAFGVVLDKVTKVVTKHIKASPLVTSILTNGAIALVAGVCSFVHAKLKQS